MRVRTRIGLLLVLVAVAFAGGQLALRQLQRAEVEPLRAEREAERERLLEQRLALDAESLRSFAERHSLSDDLVAELRAPTRTQRPAQLDNALPRFRARIAWLLDREFAPRYAASGDNKPVLHPFPLTPEGLAESFGTQRFPHFFALSPEGLLELSGAPVQPASDTARLSPPEGYLLVARLWDSAYLDSLTQASGLALALRPLGGDGADAAPPPPGRVLTGSQGEPVAVLERVAGAPTGAESPWAALARDLPYLLLATLLLVGLLYALLRRWFGRPLAALAESLRSGNPALPETLDRGAAEFGQISRAIDHLHGERSDLASRVSAQGELEAKLAHAERHDALTGLPNRTLFLERLAEAVSRAERRGTRLALLLVDLDRFKNVNDSLGHAAGDRLLKILTERLAAAVPEPRLLARLGGDEYAVGLEDLAGADAAAQLAGRLLERLGEPVVMEGHELVVSASLGISVYPEDGADAETLIKHADRAMYRAKEEGRGNFQFFDLSLRDQTTTRLTLESSLRRALEREELSLLYQPRLDLATGRITSAEALIRWQHPTLGLISPEQFISLAEEIGLIVPIGHWMVRAACAQNLAWQRAGLPAIRVAVNVSAVQFRQDNVSSEVIAALEQTGLEPRWLELELTEGLLVHSFESTSRHVTRLRELGVSFAIDDFGVGYSALGYLRRLPIDIIKVDRSFVQDLPDDADDAALVDAIIRMAHGLRLRVVAEGVETEAQAELLRRQGCDEIQGYHVSRPLPAEGLARLLEVERTVRSIKPVG